MGRHALILDDYEDGFNDGLEAALEIVIGFIELDETDERILGELIDYEKFDGVTGAC